MMRAGELDLAIVYDFDGIPGRLDESLDKVHLIDDRYDLPVARDHPLAHGAAPAGALQRLTVLRSQR